MTTRTSYRITVRGHPPGPNHRLCWQARNRINREFKDQVAWQVKALGLRAPLQKARIQVTWVYKRRPFRDEDNAVASSKAAVDGLIVGGLIVDDGPGHLVWMPLKQETNDWRGIVLDVWPVESEVRE